MYFSLNLLFIEHSASRVQLLHHSWTTTALQITPHPGVLCLGLISGTVSPKISLPLSSKLGAEQISCWISTVSLKTAEWPKDGQMSA